MPDNLTAQGVSSEGRSSQASSAKRLAAVALAFMATASVAMAFTFFPGGRQYSRDEVSQFFANSSNPYIANNASTFTKMSFVETAGTGNTGIFNGSCCTGLMQMNTRNIYDFGGTQKGMTRAEFAQLDGQQQIDAYTRYYNSIQNDPNIKKVQNLAETGGYIGNHKVSADTVAACIQFGTGNCQAAMANGCSDRTRGNGGDNYKTVCEMAETARAGKDVKNPGKNCTPASSSSPTQGTPTTSEGTQESAKPASCPEQEQANLDKTSKTCNPTVPMLQAIPCEKYPSNLQGFCNKYKPLQMNMSECQAAEKYAEKATKGNRENECANQTFGKGTSAWSFVLACSYAKTDQGQLGDSTQAKQQTSGSSGSGGGQTTGTEADPQCVNKLRAKIPDLKVLGQYSFGGGCTVASAVRFRGKAVDFGSELTMDCSLAEKMEEFGEALKGMGVTRMTNYGTLACRNIRNASGTSNSKSSHGYGMAVDIAAFQTGSGQISVTKYFSDQSARNFLENQMLPLACKTFKGVLGPRFYKGKYLHYHFETKTRTRCDGSN